MSTQYVTTYSKKKNPWEELGAILGDGVKKAQTEAPKEKKRKEEEEDDFLAGFRQYENEEKEQLEKFAKLRANADKRAGVADKVLQEAEKQNDDFLAGLNEYKEEEKEAIKKLERANAPYVVATPLTPAEKVRKMMIDAGVNKAKSSGLLAETAINDDFLLGLNPDDRDFAKPEKIYITDENAGLPKINKKTYIQDSYPFAPTIHTLSDSQEILYAKKEKPNYSGNPNKRKGSEDRQPTGARERNVGHPDGEEHSRVPKGSGGRARGNIRRAEADSGTIGKAVVGGIAAAGAGYLIYRGVRLLPSLLPALWWTLPANLATP